MLLDQEIKSRMTKISIQPTLLNDKNLAASLQQGLVPKEGSHYKKTCKY